MTECHTGPEEDFRQICLSSAIMGQGLMKKALLLNVIDPGMGGVLIGGERGTAKSTAVRALGTIFYRQLTVEGCRFGCNPDSPGTMCEEGLGRADRKRERREMRAVELSVSATEDKVIGNIDPTSAKKTGRKRFEPGILAEANRFSLYVDEVNLLNDHVVDVLLDVATMEVNIVERGAGLSPTLRGSYQRVP